MSEENTLIIDTSYGSTVGILGHEPIVCTDSHTHVEQLQANIATVVEQAGLTPQDLDKIIVGVGPAPFTGLRAGIVTAKALAMATGAKLEGRNILEAQHVWNMTRTEMHIGRVMTLAINDARRNQLYFALYEGERDGTMHTIIEPDIDYPESMIKRVNAQMDGLDPIAFADMVGHGVEKYQDEWWLLNFCSERFEESVLDRGARGLELFAASTPVPVEPLYLRRPDAEVPNPLKSVLGHGDAHRE